jgi:short-subunit dehydrogenase
MTHSKKWILITGTSTGIGRACTEYLASNGYYIYAGARKEKDIEELNKIENVVALKIDVTDDQTIQDAKAYIESETSNLIGLINNAGVALAGPLMDISTQDFIDQFDVNLFGVHRMTRTFLPFLLESKGRIIMISSNSGFFAAPFVGPYSSSKFAIEGYADSLRRELLLYGVKVVIIQPGRIDTPIWDKAVKDASKFKDSLFRKELYEFSKSSVKKGKSDSLDPSEVAKVVQTALEKENPKIRYMVVPDKFRNLMLKYLPERMVDKKVKKELEKLKSK